MITGGDFIEQFIEHYSTNYADYESITRVIGQKCEELCKHEGIKAVVTSRTKDKDRMREKLYERVSERPGGYGSVEEIKSDIADLCGARIALYHPVELKKVSDLIGIKLNSFTRKIHPEEDAPPAPGGEYHGQNRRAIFEHQNVGLVRVEIQIMSLLMSAWSEISHEDRYQEREGKLPAEEISAPKAEEILLLKEINRLVLGAEEKIWRYQGLVRQRPFRQNEPFSSVYDLREFFETFGFSDPVDNGYVIYQMDLLFWLVSNSGYNTPLKLMPSLFACSIRPCMRRTLAEEIFANNPDLIMPYMFQKSPHLTQNDEERKPIERAVENWRVLDRVLRFLAKKNGNEARTFFSINDHIRLAKLSEEEGRVVRWGWGLTDSLAHTSSGRQPSLIDEWNNGISADMQRLSSSADPAMAAAFEWARSSATEPPHKWESGGHCHWWG